MTEITTCFLVTSWVVVEEPLYSKNKIEIGPPTSKNRVLDIEMHAKKSTYSKLQQTNMKIKLNKK